MTQREILRSIIEPTEAEYISRAVFMNGYTTGIRYAPCDAEKLFKDANWIPSQQINAWIVTKG
ncbi:hypothetical protein OROMI_027061 [Orobanche minor]